VVKVACLYPLHMKQPFSVGEKIVFLGMGLKGWAGEGEGGESGMAFLNERRESVT